MARFDTEAQYLRIRKRSRSYRVEVLSISNARQPADDLPDASRARLGISYPDLAGPCSLLTCARKRGQERVPMNDDEAAELVVEGWEVVDGAHYGCWDVHAVDIERQTLADPETGAAQQSAGK